MKLLTRKSAFYLSTFLKYDLKASVTVFFVALPLCLGIAMASNAPVYSGLLAGVIGGIIVSLISRSPLSVSGPAAGLTAICAGAILELGSIEQFFIAVAAAGILQILLGLFRLGGFTHFIPSSVIKGMLAAIGILLISKQIPLILGYDKPDFWTKELFNIISFRHGFHSTENFLTRLSTTSIVITSLTFLVMFFWNRFLQTRLSFIPLSFIVVLSGSLIAFIWGYIFPDLQLNSQQFVHIPAGVFKQIQLPHFSDTFNILILKNAILICFVATLETLLSVEAIDKLEPYNRVTPQNRELVAQGTGNMLSGLLGGLPITAVIVRSSANAEAGAKTRASGVAHGIWLILALLIAIPLLNKIPYCVLALVLFRTGFNLAKPLMFTSVYKQGREQFLPFIVTIIAVLLTDLLIGVVLGFIYSIYFLIKHTFRAGYTLTQKLNGNITVYTIELALNVSFLNKKRFMEMLDKIPPYSEVRVNGSKSIYIDHDILEIFHDFKPKARNRHIELTMTDIPDVETIELH
jgi:MFS superfamily sulfate permease-like transporter